MLLKLKCSIVVLFVPGIARWRGKLVSIDEDVANRCLDSFGNGIDHGGYVNRIDLRHVVGFLQDRIRIQC